jgi:hypothetical protein
MADHNIPLTATIDPDDPKQIIVTGPVDKKKLDKGSGPHFFKFKLDDKTTKKVKFLSVSAADNCSTCPPDSKKPNTQIDEWEPDNDPPAGKPRKAKFTDWNDNPVEMDVSYLLRFTCNDPSMRVLPFDPIIRNGGSN